MPELLKPFHAQTKTEPKWDTLSIGGSSGPCARAKDGLCWKIFMRLIYQLHKNNYKRKSGGFYFAFASAMERQTKFPQFSFRICFRNDHVGHAQTIAEGHTNERKSKSQRLSFAFAIQQNPKSRDLYYCFANCFCEDGRWGWREIFLRFCFFPSFVLLRCFPSPFLQSFAFPSLFLRFSPFIFIKRGKKRQPFPPQVVRLWTSLRGSNCFSGEELGASARMNDIKI